MPRTDLGAARWASQEHQPDVPVGSEKACTPIVAADALVQIENMSTHEFLTEYKTRRTPNTRGSRPSFLFRIRSALHVSDLAAAAAARHWVGTSPSSDKPNQASETRSEHSLHACATGDSAEECQRKRWLQAVRRRRGARGAGVEDGARDRGRVPHPQPRNPQGVSRPLKSNTACAFLRQTAYAWPGSTATRDGLAGRAAAVT